MKSEDQFAYLKRGPFFLGLQQFALYSKLNTFFILPFGSLKPLRLHIKVFFYYFSPLKKYTLKIPKGQKATCRTRLLDSNTSEKTSLFTVNFKTQKKKSALKGNKMVTIKTDCFTHIVGRLKAKVVTHKNKSNIRVPLPHQEIYNTKISFSSGAQNSISSTS